MIKLVHLINNEVMIIFFLLIKILKEQIGVYILSQKKF